MQSQPAAVSAGFKKKALGAIFAIILFILVYLLLIATAIGLTIVCCYIGLQIIIVKPMLLTIALGLGLASVGILILIFLLKFTTKKHEVDYSHLTQIHPVEEPELFAFINEIAREAKTGRPKKIFLSADVNASVFYNSTFWSMFFPVKKNLQIGLGLVATVSKSEFKAILAHEFGHFSQSSMKVGSYVYNVNKIIYNMLYDNESYVSLASAWAQAGSVITLFVQLAVRITQGIQWILQKVYMVVNLSHRSLSREMEFHADAVAAGIAGSKPLVTSLSRMGLADQSYNVVLNFYGNKIEEAVSTANIYPQQQFVLHFLAAEDGLTFENGLPLVNEAQATQYNKSRIVIKDQWASHPETSDRIEALDKLNILKTYTEDGPAENLFQKPEQWQQTVTEKLFAQVTYQKKITLLNKEGFADAFTTHYRSNSFSRLFNHYYDNRNPLVLDVDSFTPAETSAYQTEELFSEENAGMVNTRLALENDIHILNQLASGQTHIKSFDYNGNKYKVTDAGWLVADLKKEEETLQNRIAEHDRVIYRHFLTLAQQQNKTAALKEKYQAQNLQEQTYEAKNKAVQQISADCAFIENNTRVEVIQQNFAAMRPLESEFKKQITALLESPVIQQDLTEGIRNTFNQYLKADQHYFNGSQYNQDALNLLFGSLRNYTYLLSKSYFNVKKELLLCFEELHTHAAVQHV